MSAFQTLPAFADAIATPHPEILPALPKDLPRVVLEEEKAKLRQFFLKFYNEKKHLKNGGGKILTYPYGDEEIAWEENPDFIEICYNNNFKADILMYNLADNPKGFIKQFCDAFAKYQVILDDLNKNRKAKIKSIYITIHFREDEVSYTFVWCRYDTFMGSSEKYPSETYTYAPTDFM